jgi:glucose-1-phosphate adenylyltransferase
LPGSEWMIVKNVMGIVSLQGSNKEIQELAMHRPLGLIPFGGRYRLIDFTLSSMVNSGIGHVGIMLPDKARSILDHLRSGKDWDLARRHDGLFYLPSVKTENSAREGDLKNFYYNIDFVKYSNQEYVLLASGNIVYNIDFSNVLRFHQNTGADITAVYNVETSEQQGESIVMETAENGLVKDIAQKEIVYEDTKVSMGIYLMSKKLFVGIVRCAYEHGGSDFLLDAIIRQAGNYSIYGYEHRGYVARITSTASYYKANMEMLRPEIWQGLFMGGAPIYTKTKDEVPVQYKDTALVTNSLVANGCIVRGEVENSILFRGVRIGRGAKIRNCIIMQKCDLQDNSLVENVICDKNVIITKDKWLKGAPNYPFIVSKNIVI